MNIGKRCVAEVIGTMWLVLAGCGSAVLAATFTGGATLGAEVAFPLGIGLVGVSVAFGLSVLTMAYAIGHISGCHLNPAVTVGLVVGKRFPASEAVQYIIAQIVGGALGAFILYTIASGAAGFSITPEGNPFASNGFGAHSPGGYSLCACFIAEAVLTAMFLFIILGSTDEKAPAGFAPIAIGLGLTLIHLISIPVTNTSVNPARSLATAIFAGSEALGQVWLFFVAPILGAVLAGLIYCFLSCNKCESKES